MTTADQIRQSIAKAGSDTYCRVPVAAIAAAGLDLPGDTLAASLAREAAKAPPLSDMQIPAVFARQLAERLDPPPAPTAPADAAA